MSSILAGKGGRPRARMLVTGGAGFIGSSLVRQAVDRGYDVRVVDNLVNGTKKNLAGLHEEHAELLEVDIRDRQLMTRALDDMDLVVHLACLGVRHSIHSPTENHDVNATATLELLSLAREASVRRFVYVSSSEVYGTAKWVPMTEDHPTQPHTVYGGSKLAGECYARAFHDTHGFPTVVVRPFNAFGPRCHHEGDAGEVIPRLMLRCLAGQPMVIFGDGLQTRDFTFVADTAAGVLDAAEAPEAVGRTINLGLGHEVTILELAKVIARVLGKQDVPIEHLEPRPGDVRRLCADRSLAAEVLGWRPRYTLEDGLAKLAAWYEQDGRTPSELLGAETVRNWVGKQDPGDG